MSEFKIIKIEGTEQTIILRDDGYRIHFKWIEGKPVNIEDDTWILWAEYKQCDFPGISSVIVDTLMKNCL